MPITLTVVQPAKFERRQSERQSTDGCGRVLMCIRLGCPKKSWLFFSEISPKLSLRQTRRLWGGGLFGVIWGRTSRPFESARTAGCISDRDPRYEMRLRSEPTGVTLPSLFVTIRILFHTLHHGSAGPHFLHELIMRPRFNSEE